MDSLSGSVERITFTILRMGTPYCACARRCAGATTSRVERRRAGNNRWKLPELSPGEHLRLQGIWGQSQARQQFKVEVCEQVLPSTVAGMESYLGSGMVKGIGPKLAGRIVTHFREATLKSSRSSPNGSWKSPHRPGPHS